MAFAVSSTVLLALRGAQAVFAIIVLGLTAYVSSWWHTNWHSIAPGEVNFLIFASVWTLLASAYLILVPMRFSESMLHHKFAILAVETVTMIFWFAGFIALATWLTGRLCWGFVCNSVTAADVFAAFEWLLFAFTTAFAVLLTVRGRQTTARNNGPITAGTGPITEKGPHNINAHPEV